MMETPPVIKKTLVNSSTKSSLTPCRRLGLGRPSSGSLKKSLLVRTVSTPLPKDEILKSNEVSSENPTIENCEEQLKVPLKSSDILNKKSGPSVRRCLTVDSKITAKRILPVDESEVCSTDSHADHVRSPTFLNVNQSDQDGSCNLDKKGKVNKKIVVNVSKEFVAKPRVSENFLVSSTNADSSKDFTHNVHEKTQEITAEIIHHLVLSVKEKKKKLEQLRIQETYAKKHDLTELRSQTAKWATAGREALRYSMSLARHAGYSVTLKQLMAQHGFPPHLMGYNEEDDEFD